MALPSRHEDSMAVAADQHYCWRDIFVFMGLQAA
jgi:hypothetical protein